MTGALLRWPVSAGPSHDLEHTHECTAWGWDVVREASSTGGISSPMVGNVYVIGEWIRLLSLQINKWINERLVFSDTATPFKIHRSSKCLSSCTFFFFFFKCYFRVCNAGIPIFSYWTSRRDGRILFCAQAYCLYAWLPLSPTAFNSFLYEVHTCCWETINWCFFFQPHFPYQHNTTLEHELQPPPAWIWCLTVCTPSLTPSLTLSVAYESRLVSAHSNHRFNGSFFLNTNGASL